MQAELSIGIGAAPLRNARRMVGESLDAAPPARWHLQGVLSDLSCRLWESMRAEFERDTALDV